MFMHEHRELCICPFSELFLLIKIGTRLIMAGSNKSRVNSARETLGSALSSAFVCTWDYFQAQYVKRNSYFLRYS